MEATRPACVRNRLRTDFGTTQVSLPCRHCGQMPDMMSLDFCHLLPGKPFASCNLRCPALILKLRFAAARLLQ